MTERAPVPYWQQDGITIYHADCRDVLPHLDTRDFAVMLTDPPYGIAYESNRPSTGRVAQSIAGDSTTELRDYAVRWRDGLPAIVFGTLKTSPPCGCNPQKTLVWWKRGAGMGDLSFPWKPDYEMVYVLGDGYASERRTSAVLLGNVPFRGRQHHNHQKPVGLLAELLQRAPAGSVIDPFMGSRSTLRAAADLGRPAVGIEIDEAYCRVAVERLAQQALPL